MGTHLNRLAEAILTSTHNICFYGELTKIIFQLLWNTLLICFSVLLSECDAQADIVFLLDSSGSVGSANFQKMLGFVRNVANSFNIGPKDVQIGVDTFQTSVKSEFNLNTYPTKQPMLSAINNIKYTQGLTHTGQAISFMANDSFTIAHGLYSLQELCDNYMYIYICSTRNLFTRLWQTSVWLNASSSWTA